MLWAAICNEEKISLSFLEELVIFQHFKSLLETRNELTMNDWMTCNTKFQCPIDLDDLDDANAANAMMLKIENWLKRIQVYFLLISK